MGFVCANLFAPRWRSPAKLAVLVACEAQISPTVSHFPSNPGHKPIQVQHLDGRGLFKKSRESPTVVTSQGGAAQAAATVATFFAASFSAEPTEGLKGKTYIWR